jgi:hypothetical protein
LLTYNAGHDLVNNPSISADIINNGARFFYNLQNNSVFVAENKKLDVKLYPNPSTGLLYCETAQPGGFNIQIHSLQGKLVIDKQLDSTVPLDLSFLPAGMYLAYIKQGSAIKTEKIILHP